MDFPNKEDKAFKGGLTLLIYHVYCIVHVLIITYGYITINLNARLIFLQRKTFHSVNILFNVWNERRKIRWNEQHVQYKDCTGVLYYSDEM